MKRSPISFIVAIGLFWIGQTQAVTLTQWGASVSASSADCTFLNCSKFDFLFTGFGVGIDSQGNILVTGLQTKPDLDYSDYDIPVFRLDPNGVLDTSFGDKGMALYDGGDREQCYDLVVQCDDSVLVTGHSGTTNNAISDWALVVLKYDPNGLLDTTFGDQGVFSYNPTENTEWGYGLTLQPDGKIVVTGQAHNSIDDDVILLRLQNSPCDVNEPNELSPPDGMFDGISSVFPG